MLSRVNMDERLFPAILRRIGAVCLVGQLISCGTEARTSLECPEHTVGFAEEVVATNFGEGESFGQNELPEIVTGAPLGGGCCMGSFDVVSLGNGGSITLGFGQRTMIDGPGADFIVFENAFLIGGDPDQVFAEFGQVEVSEDGSEWLAFPCDVVTGVGCAGRTPTLAHPDKAEVDVFEPDEAGGDAFDLADVGLKSAKFVRISDIVDDHMGFDLDAVALIHGSCN